MKKLLTILLFILPIFSIGQQIVSLCTESLLKEYFVNPYTNIAWTINPEISMNVDNNIVYITYSDIGTYVLTATYFNEACEHSDKIIIDVIQCLETMLYIPTSFTPNYDEVNDYFGAYGLNLNSFNMRIYNRWGELLFESNDLNNRWDGYYFGHPSQIDVYTYVIIYQDNKNRFFQETSTFTLTR